uniref:Protein kinase domain-containing protein n=1 Tax=Alexandrium monilatum TaxID=311494 RepID=A0A6T0VEZ7_9DINO|mmetsp:Transcript_110380/g.352113  ORF Transcript_110380/g.352113 Transcript_110380/m.352113 type:complete len:694 (+) Transcript_110380:78-2159(+)
MAGGSKIQSPSKSPSNQSGVGSPPKVQVVGPNVRGKREEYQLVRRLQSALFGGVYEAKGLSSGRDFAIKVLHKSELSKAQETNSIEFCEVPLSEIHFAELMRGDEHVMEAEEHFEDLYCFYVVFDLCRGGDLLEALKQKPHGFEESHAQFLIKQAAKGLAYLHKRRVAMQDVSLENMLLHVNETSGHYQVKVCDPGQAVIFDTDLNGEELPVNFRGLVGKSFRPPELHDQKPYQATKVDSWCLGWSTFYLLTAQPLFMSADPQQQDADWLLFQQGEYTRLFQQKSNLCSRTGLDFIFRLLQLEPSRRMSIPDALEHVWLADPKIMPVMAPQELLPESLRTTSGADRELEAQPQEMENVGGSSHHVAKPDPLVREALPLTVASATVSGTGGTLSPSKGSATSTFLGASHSLPMWAGTSVPTYAQPRSPTLRDRGRHAQPHPGAAARNPYVIATAHSPPPQLTHMSHGHLGAALSMGEAQPPRQYVTPRALSRPKLQGTVTSPLASSSKADVAADGERRVQDRAWTFRSAEAATPADGQKYVPSETVAFHGRQVHSPGRKQGVVYLPRSPSPPAVDMRVAAGSATIPVRLTVRSPSPVAGSHGSSGGFVWAQAPGISPRGTSAAPPPVIQPGSPVTTVRTAVGFAWSPDPPSPRTSPRSYSPTNPGAFTFAAPGTARPHLAFGAPTSVRSSNPRR